MPLSQGDSIRIWVVVSNIFYFHPYLGKIPIFWLVFFKGVETTNQVSIRNLLIP